MNNTTLKTNNRIISYDVMRIFAAVAVVMIHSVAEFIKDCPVMSIDYAVMNIIDSITRFSVPLFVMISGALILDEEKEFSMKKMSRYVLRMLIILYAWSLLYSVILNIVLPIIHDNNISIKLFVNSFIFGNHHQWYLFMVIGLYLITPILKTFVKKSNIRAVEWFIVLSVAFQFAVPIINLAVNLLSAEEYNIVEQLVGSFKIDFVGGYTTYYILGWYLKNVDINAKKRKIIYFMSSIGLITTILGVQFVNKSAVQAQDLFYSYLTVNVFLYSMGVFIFLDHFSKKIRNVKLISIIENLSRLTFGVYLIHVFFINCSKSIINFDNRIVSFLTMWLITTVASFASVYIMSKIPLIKKLIKC